MIQYLANLSKTMKILWCYFLWYLFFAYSYFDSGLDLWLRSLGIAALVGFALNLNAFSSLREMVYKGNRWQVFRFFLIPFCVSSFPVLVREKGFFLFFSPVLEENLFALSLCLVFLGVTQISKRLLQAS